LQSLRAIRVELAQYGSKQHALATAHRAQHEEWGILQKCPGEQIACTLTSIDIAKAIAAQEREQFR